MVPSLATLRFYLTLRADDALRTNLHLHGLFLDGAYGEDAAGARRLARASAPSPAEVESVLARIVRKARAYLDERNDAGALDEDDSLSRTTRALRPRHRPSPLP